MKTKFVTSILLPVVLLSGMTLFSADGLDYILRNRPDAISRVHTDEAEQGIVFDVQNRRIIIRRNGQEYDVMGTKIQK